MKKLMRICLWLYVGQMVVGIIFGVVVGVVYKDNVVAFAYCAAQHADKLAAIGSCI